MPFHPRDARVGACADYLLGKPLKEIKATWGVGQAALYSWMRAPGHFKLRKRVREAGCTSRQREINEDLKDRQPAPNHYAKRGPTGPAKHSMSLSGGCGDEGHPQR
jgi:hypothetical protein